MEVSRKKGRSTVIYVIIIIVMSEIVTAGFNDLGIGLVIRWALTLAMCYFLYQGRNWARWLTAALSGFAGAAGVIAGSILLTQSLFGILLIAMSLVDIGCAVALIFGPGVADYFENAY